jgi:putative membrane protein
MRSNYIAAALLTSALTIVGCSRGEISNANSSNLGSVVHNTNSQNTNTAGNYSALTAQDRTFVDKAAIGGMAEVQLGQLAVKNAKSADVKKFGQRMIDDHTKANNELTSLATAKGLTPPAELDSKNKSTLERLSRLSGDQFDKAYMSDMVTDHEQDVAEFQKQANGNGDPAIKAFASKTLPTLQEHLQLAKSIASKEK